VTERPLVSLPSLSAVARDSIGALQLASESGSTSRVCGRRLSAPDRGDPVSRSRRGRENRGLTRPWARLRRGPRIETLRDPRRRPEKDEGMIRQRTARQDDRTNAPAHWRCGRRSVRRCVAQRGRRLLCRTKGRLRGKPGGFVCGACAGGGQVPSSASSGGEPTTSMRRSCTERAGCRRCSWLRRHVRAVGGHDPSRTVRCTATTRSDQ
jgi:hypothetical protein